MHNNLSFYRGVKLCRVKEMFSGGQSERETPGPMPNPEVKPASADGTVWGTHGRVGRCQKTDLRRRELT